MSHLKQPPLKAQVLEASLGQCSWVPGGLGFSLSHVSPPNHDVGGSVPPCREASRQHRSKSNNVDSSQRTGLFKPGSLLFETGSHSMAHAGSLTLEALPRPPEFGITGIQHIRLRGGLGRLQSTRTVQELTGGFRSQTADAHQLTLKKQGHLCHVEGSTTIKNMFFGAEEGGRRVGSAQ